MTKTNWSRVVMGGLLWAAVYGGLGALAMFAFLGREFMRELEELGRPLKLSSDFLLPLGVFGVVFTISWGIITIWLYAALRPRCFSDRRTAVITSLVVWLLSVAAPVSHLAAFGISSFRFVVIDLPTDFLLILVATLVAARTYRE